MCFEKFNSEQQLIHNGKKITRPSDNSDADHLPPPQKTTQKKPQQKTIKLNKTERLIYRQWREEIKVQTELFFEDSLYPRHKHKMRDSSGN